MITIAPLFLSGLRNAKTVLLSAFAAACIGMSWETAAADEKHETSPADKMAFGTEGWMPLDLTSLLVKPGSALDFSCLVEQGPAGKHGFVKINRQAELVFENQPNRPLRFFTASDCLGWSPMDSAADIEEYARQVRLAGYNCFRTHFLDEMLERGSREDLEPNPTQVDKWDRLSAALKKEGVYLYLDIATSNNSFYASSDPGHSLMTRIYYDPEAREHWVKAMRWLLERVNPYTGVALKDEPQVILFQARNESGLYFNAKEGKLDPAFQAPFDAWLAKKYGNIDQLNAAWESGYGQFREVPLVSLTGSQEKNRDLQRFALDLEVETFKWLKSEIDKVGVKVPVIDYNVGVEFGHDLSRATLPMVDTHAYHDLQTAYISPGSTLTNQSATEKGLDMYVWLNESRQLDRPFLVSEWGYPYWNCWRYEAGLTVPAFAALQGWSLLTQHSEPIRTKVRLSLRPHFIAYDPPLKVAERIAALLYARGDVTLSPHTVEIQLDPAGIFERWGGAAYFPDALRKLSLLTRSGKQIVDFADKLPGGDFKADATLKMDRKSKNFIWKDAGQKMEGASQPSLDAAQVVDYLHGKGVLGPDNKTNVAKGIYQSDTQQLTLNIPGKTIEVDTPLSQGAALPKGAASVVLSSLEIKNLGGSGTVFASSLDFKDLALSQHMLIMAVGDARNSNTIFKEANCNTLEDLGGFPILCSPMDFEVKFKRSLKGVQPHFWALSFNGERWTELPVQVTDDSLSIRIDTSKLPSAAFYFELLLEETR